MVNYEELLERRYIKGKITRDKYIQLAGQLLLWNMTISTETEESYWVEDEELWGDEDY